MIGDEAGYAISKLCTGRAIKNVSVDRSAEPFVTHWDEEMANESWKRNMFRYVKTLKYKECTGENAVSVQTETKWLGMRQIMQSANCALTRRLKMGR